LRARMFLAGFLAIWIGRPAPVFGQQPPPQPQATPAPAPTVETLKILVLQGQNAVNSIRDGIVEMPVVEVHDENDQPLEGAEVTYELPATGPGGTFPGGKSTETVKSNLQGQAGAGPILLNPETGKFVIKVTAALRNRTGHTTITQTNVLDAAAEKAKKHHITWWKVAIVAGAVAAVVGIILATRGGSSSSSNTVTLAPGVPTFGTP
jgi:hypothetical protein